jgi:hypothetical protein
VLICGSAWTLPDDYGRALEAFPGAPVIAVNGAAGEIPCQFLFSQHPLNMPRWIEWRHSRFGAAFEVHAAGERHRKTRLGGVAECPWVDHYWNGVASNGSSAWGARRLASAMWFDLVVFCGVPLEPGPYAYDDISKQNRHEAVMEHYRAAIMEDTEMHAGVRSMSGWTREVFGSP